MFFVLGRKCLIYRCFLEKHNSEDLQNLARTSGDHSLFGDDRHQHIHTHRNPDLCLDRVGRRAVERFDSKILFDPFEEEFYLPSITIEIYDVCAGMTKLFIRKLNVLTVLLS